MMRILRDLADIARDAYLRLVLWLTDVLPGSPDNSLVAPLRRLLLRAIRVEAGAGTQISRGLFIAQPGRVVFGVGCRIGFGFRIWNFAAVQVGDDLLASHGVSLICGNHLTDDRRTNVPGPVAIGRNVWIGANVTIVGPCTIGDNVIIGANSFVTGTVESGAVVAGSPARRIR